MGLLDIPAPYRLPILERLARDGDDYAAYVQSYVLPRTREGREAPAARRWRRRAERTLLAAQLDGIPYPLHEDGRPRRLSPVHRTWVRRAARHRHPQGLHAYAWSLRGRSRQRAALTRAARARSSRAAYDLALRVETLAGDLGFVRRWLRVALLVGMRERWTEAAETLVSTAAPFLRRVRADDREAVRWYRRAAARGCPAATANLGRCYRDGHGVRKSPRLAARWFRRAAEVFDSARAAFCLGRMYLGGELGTPDARRVFLWFRRAAAGGDADALSDVGVAYHNGRGVAKDQDFAALLDPAAAAAGDGWGAYVLGLSHRDGEGVRRSRRSAARWFRVAIEWGVKPGPGAGG